MVPSHISQLLRLKVPPVEAVPNVATLETPFIKVQFVSQSSSIYWSIRIQQGQNSGETINYAERNPSLAGTP